MSHAQSIGALPYCFFRSTASFPHIVVLPAPCRPDIRMTAGFWEPNSSFALVLPMSAVSSSLTILMTICPGVKLSSTSVPTARASTRFTKSLTTRKLTSASRSASLISRIASLTSRSLSRPFPVSFLNTFCSLDEMPSNAIFVLPDCGKLRKIRLERGPVPVA